MPHVVSFLLEKLTMDMHREKWGHDERTLKEPGCVAYYREGWEGIQVALHDYLSKGK